MFNATLTSMCKLAKRYGFSKVDMVTWYDGDNLNLRFHSELASHWAIVLCNEAVYGYSVRGLPNLWLFDDLITHGVDPYECCDPIPPRLCRPLAASVVGEDAFLTRLEEIERETAAIMGEDVEFLLPEIDDLD